MELVGADATRIPALRQRFVELLGAVTSLDEVSGAGALLRELCAGGVSVAIATGGWEAAARQKLRARGIDAAKIALVGSDEHISRAEILRAAIERLRDDGPVFYVGDAACDLRASRTVGVEFVAVGAESRRLAPRSVRDFVDREALARALAVSFLGVKGALLTVSDSAERSAIREGGTRHARVVRLPDDRWAEHADG